MTTRIPPIVTVLLLTVMSVFAQQAPASSAKLPEVRCDQKTEGFCDILLAVEQKSTAQDDALLVTAAGTYKNDVLELRIAIAPDMKPGSMNPVTLAPQTYSLRRGGIRFERVGPASDRLVARIAELYHTKSHPKAMQSDVHFTAFAFRGDPEKISFREVLFELSQDDPANQVPQCEMLLDVNLSDGEIRLREKNQDFRECIMRILGKEN